MRVFILHKYVVVSVSAVTLPVSDFVPGSLYCRWSEGQGLQRRCGLPVPAGSPVFKMGLTTEGVVHNTVDCCHPNITQSLPYFLVGRIKNDEAHNFDISVLQFSCH